MKRRKIVTSMVLAVVLFLAFGGGSLLANWAASFAAEFEGIESDDPDRPAKFPGRIDEEAYLRLREEYVGMRRGIDPELGLPDPRLRERAIRSMRRKELEQLRRKSASGEDLVAAAAVGSWTPLGPAPLLNGSSIGGANVRVSGRTVAVAVDPTNPNKVYIGTAQGGVWRSLDGGSTWTNIFDAADSLAIGAVAIAPSNPSIVYVGTGEPSQSGDSFFGVGVYRIENADTTANLVGPINPEVTSGSGGGAVTYNAFTGRSISRILVHPTDPATIFVATATGVGGRGNALSLNAPPLAFRGIFRSTNATAPAGSVTFTKLAVTADSSLDSPGTGNASVIDMVMEPGNPNNINASVIGRSGSFGGIYRTTNALATTPAFTQTLALSTLGVRIELAINKIGSTVTVYAATGETPTSTPNCTGANSGAVRKSIDGGATWSNQLTGGGGFCGQQCSYDIAIAVDPNDANIVYLGGQSRGACSDAMKKSTNGGATFARDDNGLHADSHGLVFDPLTFPATVYTTNDGGVWKRGDAPAGTAWINLNNAPLNTMQFVGIAVHPLDRQMIIGGTQDNGTAVQQTSPGNWTNAEGGDGGYSLIDQSVTDTSNVTMYHTFFNASNTQIYFDRALLTNCLNNKNSWPTRGAISNGNGTIPDDLSPATFCDNTANLKNNGLQVSDNVLFYAPMALGPGSPNTLYFGTDRLYRSTDRGDTMAIVSQSPITPTGTRTPPGGSTPVSVGSPISSIAISPQDDNYRIVGLQNGEIWATTTGSSTLVNITSPSFPANPASTTNQFVGRVAFDPNNNNVAYVAFAYFAPAAQVVWKITNLTAAVASPVSANWTAAANGIPSVPVSAFAIDPMNSNNLFAGTDIGVYNSADGGLNWAPFGVGLPRSAVFDMAIQNANRVLRVGTHGRGIWEISIGAAGASIVNFNQSSYAVNESSDFLPITVTRSGDTSAPATVKYTTSDATDVNFNCNPNTAGQITGAASRKCDYHIASGRLRFAAGETSKQIILSIVKDVYVEPSENLTIALSSPTGDMLGTPNTANVTITDNDAPSQANPIDGTAFYVRMLYVDLLSREPDPSGADWVHRIDFCGQPGEPPPPCDRVTVGGVGFLSSSEFFDREFFVIRLYRTALGRILRYDDVGDLAYVSGFLTTADLETNKQELVTDLMSRPEFGGIYNLLNNNQYVDKLFQTAAVSIPGGVRDGWVSALNGSTKTRAQVFRELSERTEVSARYLNEARVVSCYYGFFTRNPDAAYFTFLQQLDSGQITLGELAGAFINASEYRQRFGP